MNQIEFVQYFKDRSSPDMSVDGSETDVLFSYAPTGSDVDCVLGMSLLILDPGTMGPTNFGSISELTNGLKLEYQSQGADQVDVMNLKNNLDITCFCAAKSADFAAQGSSLVTTGWLDTADIFVGTLRFIDNGVMLKASESDYIRWRVRDDLTGIEHLRSVASMLRMENV